MKKKQWYEAPEAEILDLRLEVNFLTSDPTLEGTQGEDLDEPNPFNPWSN